MAFILCSVLCDNLCRSFCAHCYGVHCYDVLFVLFTVPVAPGFGCLGRPGRCPDPWRLGVWDSTGAQGARSLPPPGRLLGTPSGLAQPPKPMSCAQDGENKEMASLLEDEFLRAPEAPSISQLFLWLTTRRRDFRA